MILDASKLVYVSLSMCACIFVFCMCVYLYFLCVCICIFCVSFFCIYVFVYEAAGKALYLHCAVTQCESTRQPAIQKYKTGYSTYMWIVPWLWVKEQPAENWSRDVLRLLPRQANPLHTHFHTRAGAVKFEKAKQKKNVQRGGTYSHFACLPDRL